MLRPGKIDIGNDDLVEPLLPPPEKVKENDADRELDDRDDNDNNKKTRRSKSQTLDICIRRLLVFLTTASFIVDFVMDADTKYLLPGEWIVVTLCLVTWLQARSSQLRIKEDQVWNFYIVLLVILKLVAPLAVTYYVLIIVTLLQSVFLGIELAGSLKGDEELNRKLLDEEDVGLPSDITRTHWGFPCDECGVNPIVGLRYRFKQQQEQQEGEEEEDTYDLCEVCCQKKTSTSKQSSNSALFQVVRTPLPVNEHMLHLLREEERLLIQENRKQREQTKKEAMLLASNGSANKNETSNLNVV